MISVETVDGVAVLRLAHGKVNALDIELCQSISATFGDLPRAGAVVLTGAGPAFSAGVDLWRVLHGGDDYVAAFIPALVDAFAAACDHRIMTTHPRPGRIGIPEMLVGVPFPATALAIVEHAFGPPAARRLAFSGELFSAEEAHARGLVDELDGLDRAVAHARHLASAIPPPTYAATKRHLNRLPGYAEHDAEYDAEVVRLWQERVADGWIAAYMRRTVKRQGA